MAESRQSIAEAQRRLRLIPASADAYRAEMLGTMAMLAVSVRSLVDGSFGTLHGGYRLDAAAAESVSAQLDAIALTMTTGAVEFDAHEHAMVADRLLLPARQANPGVGGMLASLSALHGAAGLGGATGGDHA